MTAREAPEASLPADPRRSRADRLADLLTPWQKLAGAVAGLIVAVAGPWAAVHSFARPAPGAGSLPGASSPPASPAPDAGALAAAYRWKLLGEDAFTDASKTAHVDMTSMHQGQTAWLVVKALNTGSATWSDSGPYPVDLGTDGPHDRASLWAAAGWLSTDRPASVKPGGVGPQEVGTFEFPIVVRMASGTFDENFNLVAEGLTWFNNDVGLYFHSVVH